MNQPYTFRTLLTLASRRVPQQSSYTQFARRDRIMDISSGNLDFGRTCPGALMQDLRLSVPEGVAKIQKFQTSLSRHKVPDLCGIGCEDLDIVRSFISSIGNLEELSVINYEPDASAIWPAIFQHASFLRSLAIHTPPQSSRSLVWTPTTTREAIERLRSLKQLELDIDITEAEELVSGTGSQQQVTESVVGELAKARGLESVLINVCLPDGASVFAGARSWNAYGPTSFGAPNMQPREQLALKLFDKMQDNGSVLNHLEVRFPRRSYEDRCQFSVFASSVHIRKNEAGIVELTTERSKLYLPEWPEYGGVLDKLMRS
ncbi:hypothetical protein OQA88_4447 [Cercophora sp. LCS_1]